MTSQLYTMSLSLLLTVMVSFATLCEFDTSEKVWRKRSQLIFPLIPSERTYLCLNVFPLPVPLEGGQWVAMVGVAGESQLVPLPQRVGGQARYGGRFGGAQDLDRFRVLDENGQFIFIHLPKLTVDIVFFLLPEWHPERSCSMLSKSLSFGEDLPRP